jgi:hypothetical protein
MDAQLRLLPRSEARGADADPSTPRPGRRPVEAAEAPAQWRIDDGARERGRAGISRARQALRQARHPVPGERHTTAA